MSSTINRLLRRRIVGTAIALVIALTVVSVAPAVATNAADGERLTWAPPANWGDFEEVVIPASGGTITLEPDRDYRLSAPSVIRAAVHVRGGRHVVWIGGHISINDAGRSAPAISRRALVIGDHPNRPSTTARIVHLEGLLLDGNDLSEGIDLAAPSAVIQIQNVRVSGVYIRGADDRDGTGVYTEGQNHADVLQSWGGYRELRVDGLTGYSNYQGLYLLQDIGSPTQGPAYFRRMNLVSIKTTGEDGYEYAGHRMYRWDPAKTGQQFFDNGTVWAKHHPSSGWTESGYDRHAYRNEEGVLVADPPPGTSRFRDNLYLAPTVRKDGLGVYATWNQTLDDGRRAVRNFDDSGVGRIYSGMPAGGDYVPAPSVGVGYAGPGYHGVEDDGQNRGGGPQPGDDGGETPPGDTGNGSTGSNGSGPAQPPGADPGSNGRGPRGPQASDSPPGRAGQTPERPALDTETLETLRQLTPRPYDFRSALDVEMMLSWRPVGTSARTPSDTRSIAALQAAADEPARHASIVRAGAGPHGDSSHWARQIRFRVPGPVAVAHRTVLRILRGALALL